MKIISFWSGPRNVSTALMYSFAQRPDTGVVDEPFYGHYLRISGANHPGKELVLDEMENDGEKVLEEIQIRSKKTPVLFLKNMAHHWIGLNIEYLNDFEHVFLIRDPRQMLPSLVNQIPNPIMRDTGLKMQEELYQYLIQSGKQPIIIDAKELLLNPKNILTKVCDHLNIPFYEQMLSWPPGPKKEDGIWAKFWYQNVHKSVGFARYNEKKDPIPEHVIPLYKECDTIYQFLYTKAIKN